MRSNEFKPTDQEFNRLPAGHCGQHTPSECIGMLTARISRNETKIEIPSKRLLKRNEKCYDKCTHD